MSREPAPVNVLTNTKCAIVKNLLELREYVIFITALNHRFHRTFQEEQATYEQVAQEVFKARNHLTTALKDNTQLRKKLSKQELILSDARQELRALKKSMKSAERQMSKMVYVVHGTPDSGTSSDEDTETEIETTQRSRVTAKETTQRSGVTAIETTQRSGVTAIETTQRSGVTAIETTLASGYIYNYQKLINYMIDQNISLTQLWCRNTLELTKTEMRDIFFYIQRRRINYAHPVITDPIKTDTEFFKLLEEYK
jgi:hypothetical protein